MIKVTVPATSANLGPGFDSLGIALNLYNNIYMEEYDGVDISSLDGSFVPKGENNLIFRTAKDVYDLCGKPFKGLKLLQENPIPMARGLGSSSACICAGIVGANKLLGSPLSISQMIDLAAKMEGHPDNSTPAFVGGFVAAVFDNEHVTYVKTPVDKDLQFVAFIPDFPLKTSEARRALPKEIAHKDAVYNLSRASLMSMALSLKKYDLLPVAIGDKLHQPYRMGLIQNSEKIFDIAYKSGALAVYISGAGPTIMAITKEKNFFKNAVSNLKGTGINNWFVKPLTPDNSGAVVCEYNTDMEVIK